MPLAYVAIAPGIAKHPSIAMMAVELSMDRYALVGRMPAFLGEVGAFRPTGCLEGVPDTLLDEWAGGVEGWGAAVRNHLCDGAGTLRDWWEYNGRAIQNLERERARKRKARETVRGQSLELGADEGADTPPPVRGPSEATGTQTETIPTATTPHPAGARAWNESRLKEHLPATCHADLRSVLMHSRSGAEGVARAIAAMAGLDPKAIPVTPGMATCTPNEMGAVLGRLATAKDPSWNQSFVNRMLESVRRETAQPVGTTKQDSAHELVRLPDA